MYFCPQCGSKVLPGTAVCPQCGVELKFIIQSNSANALSTSYKTQGLKNRNPIAPQSIASELFNITPEVGMHLKYNENENPSNANDTIMMDDDMSIIGALDDVMLDDTGNDMTMDPRELEKQNKIISGAMGIGVNAVDATTSQEASKYKIITQVFDKKFGFNAVELESKLNMYAKLGYHIVPNTMICQPGQDFFALMERTTPSEQDAKAIDDKVKKNDNIDCEE